eukprot:254171-Chlamydomonas_euryale.AAC.8
MAGVGGCMRQLQIVNRSGKLVRLCMFLSSSCLVSGHQRRAASCEAAPESAGMCTYRIYTDRSGVHIHESINMVRAYVCKLVSGRQQRPAPSSDAAPKVERRRPVARHEVWQRTQPDVVRL